MSVLMESTPSCCEISLAYMLPSNTQQNFNNITNLGPKHVAFIDDVIKSLL